MYVPLPVRTCTPTRVAATRYEYLYCNTGHVILVQVFEYQKRSIGHYLSKKEVECSAGEDIVNMNIGILDSFVT